MDYKRSFRWLEDSAILTERYPFTVVENLINLATGEVADESVNVHHAFKIGEKLV